VKIGIIGGGIIGLSTAYYLRKSGHEVTILEQSNLEDGCSFRNAGMIVPSHIIPLAAPGMIAKGIRWMFNSSSPFYVHPSFNSALIKWGWEFYKHANEKHVKKSIPALRDLSLFSKLCYQQWAKELPFDFGYQERGLLMLYQKPETEKEEIEAAHIANDAGVKAQVLSADEVQQMEPDVRVNARGGVYYPGDAHLTPQMLIQNLIHHLKTQGVKLQSQTTVQDFIIDQNKIKTIKTDLRDFEFDQVVLATGSWSGTVASQLKLSLPMQAGKGYSFTLQNVEKNTRIPSIFLEARVAVTPMGNTLRFGGTMEITGVDHSINMKRVKGIVDSIPKYYPDMKVAMPKQEEVWHGLRPCSPDGLPYIGYSSKTKNLVIATGHSMMGLSLGPGTGKIVSELVIGEKPSVNLTAFNVERY
jgi:D-amino-acid dehydrogenase